MVGVEYLDLPAARLITRNLPGNYLNLIQNQDQEITLRAPGIRVCLDPFFAPCMTDKAVVAGALSGFTQVLAEQPFDTVKVRLQSRALAFDAFDGPVALMRSTYAKEGLRAFYQGVTPRLATYSAVKASLFSLFERLYETTGSTVVAGGLAGMSSSRSPEVQFERGVGHGHSFK